MTYPASIPPPPPPPSYGHHPDLLSAASYIAPEQRDSFGYPTTQLVAQTQSFTQTSGASPYELQSVLDISIDPGAYLVSANPLTYYSHDQPAQSAQPQQIRSRPQQLQQQQPQQQQSQPGAVTQRTRTSPPSHANPIVQAQRRAIQQQRQNSPSTPGMYTASSASSPSSSSLGANPTFDGNMLFWTTRDLRDTAVWGDESIGAAYVPSSNGQTPLASNDKRHVELRITTPKGYATQTRTSVQLLYGAPLGASFSMDGTTNPYANGNSGGPGAAGSQIETMNVAEFVWASPTQLGMCRFNDGFEVPMVQFLQGGVNRDSTRFPVRYGNEFRTYEWIRDPLQPEVFTLYDVNGRPWGKYVGGPFESKDLYPYMQYYWANDDALLLSSVLAITIRRWSEKYP